MLKTSTKTAYGIGQFAWASKDVIFHYFVFFFYTQIMGLSASLAGLAALIALVFDALSDPIVAQLSDRFKAGKWGRRHPFMIAASIPYSVALVLIFMPPSDLSQMQLFAWLVVISVVVRTLITVFSVPHWSLGSELSSDYNERTAITSYRNAYGYLGGILIQVAAWYFILPNFAPEELANGYQTVAIVAALFAFIGMVTAIVGTRPIISELPQHHSGQSRSIIGAYKEIFQVMSFHRYRPLQLSLLISASVVGMTSTLVLHINTYIYGFSAVQQGTFMLSVLIAIIPSVLLAKWGTKKLGKPIAARNFYILGSVIAAPMVVLAAYGFLPDKGSTALLAIVCTVIAINQTGYIAYINTAHAMIPDIVDEYEQEYGERREAVFFAALLFIGKVTFGIGTALAGLAVQFSGITPDTTAASLTSEQAIRLAWVAGPAACCLAVISAMILMYYRPTAATERKASLAS